MVGISSSTPIPPNTTTAFRAASTEKVTQIGSDERHPDGEKSLSEIDALGHEVNRKPIHNEKPNRIGERACNDGSPGLWQLEQVAPASMRQSSQADVALVGSDEISFRIADQRVTIGRLVDSSPKNDPDEAETAESGTVDTALNG
jgi:hypothetical protein